MAKVMIDIPDCYIDAVKGLMLMQADSEQVAQKMERAADIEHYGPLSKYVRQYLAY